MNECYIPNKVEKLLHVEHPDLKEKQILSDVINLMRETIELSTIELERKLIRIINTYFCK